MSNFHSRNEFDLNPLPSVQALAANGGYLLKVHVLKDMGSTREGYRNEYLQTVHWQGVKEMAYRTYGRRCTLGVECSGPLDVHHRTYDNIGEEKPDDVEVLCRKHHDMKHDTYAQFVREQCARQFNQP